MMTTPVAAASMAGFQTLFGTLPITAELPGPGTFLGVGPDQYRTAEGAAQAIESAYVLGLDVLAVKMLIPGEFGGTLDKYREAARKDNWAEAGSLQRQLADILRRNEHRHERTEKWSNIIEGLEVRPAFQWVFSGGIFATRLFPLHTQVRGDVYSDVSFVPRGIQSRYARTIGIMPCYFDPSTRQEEMDVRGIRPLHHLSEGRAAKLIAEKYRGILKKLARWKQKHRADWVQYRDEILLELTRGDKYSADDRIKVGEYFPSRGRQPGYLLLNGHRRIATLCLLAANEKIPLDWLLHIPVEILSVKREFQEDSIRQMTAGRHLSLREVLSDITVMDGISPTTALDQLDQTFPCNRPDWANPLSLVYSHDSESIYWEEWMLLAASHPEDWFYRRMVEYARQLRLNPKMEILGTWKKGRCQELVAGHRTFWEFLRPGAISGWSDYMITEAAGDLLLLLIFLQEALWAGNSEEGMKIGRELFIRAKKGLGTGLLGRLLPHLDNDILRLWHLGRSFKGGCFFFMDEPLIPGWGSVKGRDPEIFGMCWLCGFYSQITHFFKEGDVEELASVLHREDPNASILENLPRLIAVRSLLNSLKNEHAQSLEPEMALREMLKKIKWSSWDAFLHCGFWRPIDIKKLMVIESH